MPIFDGFKAHIDYRLVDFCSYKIPPFCLLAHTSHIFQLLDIGGFSALKTYFQEANSIHDPIDRNTPSSMLVHAQNNAFIKEDIQSGFRETKIYPYSPNRVLNIARLREPTLIPLPLGPQAQHQQLTFNPPTSTTPRSVHNRYAKGLSTILTTSPRS